MCRFKFVCGSADNGLENVRPLVEGEPLAEDHRDRPDQSCAIHRGRGSGACRRAFLGRRKHRLAGQASL